MCIITTTTSNGKPVHRNGPATAPAAGDAAKTAAARQAQERALVAIDKAIAACELLGQTGDSAAAVEGRMLAKAIHRLTEGLYNTHAGVRERPLGAVSPAVRQAPPGGWLGRGFFMRRPPGGP
jgi:hypothetical protein